MLIRPPEEYYLLVAKELETGQKDEGLWLKCYAKAKGSTERAEALYLDNRADALFKLQTKLEVELKAEQQRIQYLEKQRAKAEAKRLKNAQILHNNAKSTKKTVKTYDWGPAKDTKSGTNLLFGVMILIIFLAIWEPVFTHFDLNRSKDIQIRSELAPTQPSTKAESPTHINNYSDLIKKYRFYFLYELEVKTSEIANKQVSDAWVLQNSDDKLNWAKAYQLNKLGFESGHSEGASNIGLMFERGQIINKNGQYKADISKAIDYYEKAIQNGPYHSAQAELGLLRISSNFSNFGGIENFKLRTKIQLLHPTWSANYTEFADEYLNITGESPNL